MKTDFSRFLAVLPLVALVAAAITVPLWLRQKAAAPLMERLPATDQTSGNASGNANPVLTGIVVPGPGQPSDLPGLWPQFRGPDRNGISLETQPLARDWGSNGPRQLWAVDCGEGYAGAAVRNGRVYLMDYDDDKKQNALRCLSLADGREIWRYAYTLPVKRNHGMTRTIPAVSEKYVVAMDPKCHVFCLDEVTGKLRWSIDLVREFGATIPPWYTGQCPLIDGTNVILAPGGTNALLAAVDLENGNTVWRAANPHEWKMTHSSVMPMDFAGRHFYVYCGSGGVTAVDATNGALLWDTDAWKISIANVPSPLALGGGRILLAGGYNAGSMLLQLKEKSGFVHPEILWKLPPNVFGATQHTPIFHDGHIFGTRPDGKFVCLGEDGKIIWTSPAGTSFGMGPFLLAPGEFFVMNESGNLALVEDSAAHFNLLARSQVLTGHESWAPMALAGGRLLARDSTHLVCLDVTPPPTGQ